MAIVVFGYEPQHPDELVLAEGEMVEITKQVSQNPFFKICTYVRPT